MSPLRILSLQKGADTAGQGIRMKQAFDRHAPDWSFRSMVQRNVGDYIGYPYDLQWRNPTVKAMWPDLDVVHVHNNFATLQWTERNYRHASHMSRKPSVLHHHGTQLRQNRGLLDEQRERQAIGIVSTLDLWLMAPDELTWLPAPYDIEWLASLRNPHGGDKIRVAHAPTNEMIKSTRPFVAAMERLISEGYPVEMDLIKQTSWAECLRRKATADIFFDQVILGFGCNSIEAWGMGIPVVSGVDPERAASIEHPIGDVESEYQRRFGSLPYYPATESTIYESLRALIDNPALRAEYAQRGNEYVRLHHSDEKIVAQLQDTYHHAMERHAA